MSEQARALFILEIAADAWITACQKGTYVKSKRPISEETIYAKAVRFRSLKHQPHCLCQKWFSCIL